MDGDSHNRSCGKSVFKGKTGGAELLSPIDDPELFSSLLEKKVYLRESGNVPVIPLDIHSRHLTALYACLMVKNTLTDFKRIKLVDPNADFARIHDASYNSMRRMFVSIPNSSCNNPHVTVRNILKYFPIPVSFCPVVGGREPHLSDVYKIDNG